MQSKVTALAFQVLMLGAWLPVHSQAGEESPDPFISRVVSFTPGSGAGFGSDRLPDVILGPPRGGGATQGSLDVVSLGDGGEIVVELEAGICDRPGPDFTVFENAFHAGDPSGPIFAEVGIVAVSEDGVEFVEFPYDAETYAGLAGVTPVFSDVGNGVDPLDPVMSGGDSVDLADIGLTSARFVRISDPGALIADPGNRVPPGISGGFDLDAIAALHPCSPVATPGDLDDDGDVDAADFDLLARAVLHDADESIREAADVNGDGALTAADLTAAALLTATM